MRTVFALYFCGTTSGSIQDLLAPVSKIALQCILKPSENSKVQKILIKLLKTLIGFDCKDATISDVLGPLSSTIVLPFCIPNSSSNLCISSS